MSLSFLAPAILAGLLALAIPVYLHLTQRRKQEPVEFPSLMFLRKIPYRETRKQRIRHWLLLAARCLALVLLVAAFARPVFQGDAVAAGNVLGSTEVVILVDRSYSMAHGDRWTRALDAARQQVARLGPEDRASLVFFDQGAHAAARSTADPAELRAALDTARVGSQATRYGPGLRLAGTILEQSRLARKEAVLISDFQEEGWTGEEDFRLPGRTSLIPVPVGGPEAANALVAAVSFRRDLVSGRERVVASARVTNRGAEALAELPVTLEVGGREMETVSVDVEPGTSETVTFAPFTLTDPDTRGAVRIPEDALPVDDVRRFVLSPGQAVGVLVLEGGRRAEESLFLRRALEIGQEPAFRVLVKPVSAFRPEDLEDRSVVVLNDAPFPGGARGRVLAGWVEDGGGLLVGLGEASSFPGAAGAVMPGRVGAAVDRREGRGGLLSQLEYSHPVFELFRTPRSGDFTGARFFRYREVEVEAPGAAGQGAEGGSEVQVLARFDDGAPALVERRPGQGRVLVWTSTLDDFWNDLALQPVYLPFVHQTARHLAGWRPPVPWLTAGQVLALGSEPGDDSQETGAAGGGSRDRLEAVVGLHSWEGGDRVARTPSGRILPLPSGEESGFLSLDEHGFWEIRTPGPEARSLATLAVNPDLSESRLEPLDPEELARSVAGPSAEGRTAQAAGQEGITLEDRERRQSLWRYLLLGAFLLLAAETVASNVISKRRVSNRSISKHTISGKAG